LKEIGFFQCPFDKSLFCKWFSNTRIGILWQHVDDRLAGFSELADLEETARLLGDKLGSVKEGTESILGHDNEYNRSEGWMKWRCLTKINALIANEHLEKLALHNVPMTKAVFETMTKANCPQTPAERALEHKSIRPQQFR
jgi:hypothetical protein